MTPILFQTNTDHSPTFIQASWQHGQLHILIRRHRFRRRHNVYTKIIESGHQMKRTHVTNIKSGNVQKKSLAVPKKNERGESLVSPGMVYYTEEQEKPFSFSSLDQIVHFDAIIFCRTFVELFWSVRVDRKKSHYNRRVSLHEAPTKKPTWNEITSIKE